VSWKLLTWNKLENIEFHLPEKGKKKKLTIHVAVGTD
jgi:hypothetical protein